MIKSLTISWKDTLIRFRDRNALLLMLVAPLVLSAIMGAAFGSFQSDSVPMANIPLIIVNDDEGEIGQHVVDTLTSAELTDLLEPTRMDDVAAARELVERGSSRALVYIPAHFSDGIRSFAGERTTEIQLYTDPVAPVTANIIHVVVSEISTDLGRAAISKQISVEMVQEKGDELDLAFDTKEDVLSDALDRARSNQSKKVQLNWTPVGNETNSNNMLAYFVPSMAIFFLFFAMFSSARSILDEQQAGTLARLMSTPLSIKQILLGKIGGAFLTGFLQFLILVIASRLIFNLHWGNSLVALLLMASVTVLAVTSLGLFIATFARDSNQANILGGIVILISAVLGGNFFIPATFPDWLQALSYLTLNRWALEGLSDLTQRNGGLQQIWQEVSVLLSYAFVFFSLATFSFRRRFVR